MHKYEEKNQAGIDCTAKAEVAENNSAKYADRQLKYVQPVERAC